MLEELDFMVAVDIYLNETTRHADLILPSTVQLEHENYDFLFQTTSIRNMARWSPAVFEPEPEPEEYHTPRDTPDTLNYEGTAKIARLLALMTRGLALRSEAPDFVPHSFPRARTPEDIWKARRRGNVYEKKRPLAGGRRIHRKHHLLPIGVARIRRRAHLSQESGHRGLMQG